MYRKLIEPLWRIQSSRELLDTAIDLHSQHSFSWWDSLILSAAIQGGCSQMLSEDLQHGRENPRRRESLGRVGESLGSSEGRPVEALRRPSARSTGNWLRKPRSFDPKYLLVSAWEAIVPGSADGSADETDGTRALTNQSDRLTELFLQRTL